MTGRRKKRKKEKKKKRWHQPSVTWSWYDALDKYIQIAFPRPDREPSPPSWERWCHRHSRCWNVGLHLHTSLYHRVVTGHKSTRFGTVLPTHAQKNKMFFVLHVNLHSMSGCLPDFAFLNWERVPPHQHEVYRIHFLITNNIINDRRAEAIRICRYIFCPPASTPASFYHSSLLNSNNHKHSKIDHATQTFRHSTQRETVAIPGPTPLEWQSHDCASCTEIAHNNSWSIVSVCVVHSSPHPHARPHPPSPQCDWRVAVYQCLANIWIKQTLATSNRMQYGHPEEKKKKKKSKRRTQKQNWMSSDSARDQRTNQNQNQKHKEQAKEKEEGKSEERTHQANQFICLISRLTCKYCRRVWVISMHR